MIDLRFLLGMAVSLAFVALFFLIVDVGEMWDALAHADYAYVAPAIFLYFAALVVRAFRWSYLLSPVAQIPPGRLFSALSVGYMANNLLPARLGEIVRAYYLRRREGISVSSGLATVVVERVYDGLTLLFLVALSVPFLISWGVVDGFNSASERAVLIGLVITALAFIPAIVTLTLITLRPSFGKFVIDLGNLAPRGLRPKARELIALFVDGLSALREPRRHLGLFLWSLPVWLLEGSMYLVIAFSFDLPSYFEPAAMVIPVVILVTAASNLATAIPSSPGSVGTFEAPAVAALALVGLSGAGSGEGVAGAYAVLVHVTALAPVTILGLAYLWVGNVSLRKLMKGDDALHERSGDLALGDQEKQ